MVLYLKVSHDEEKIAVCMGHPTVGDHYKVTNIIVMEKDADLGIMGAEFKISKKLDLNLENTCKEFHFNNKNTDELFFFTKSAVVKLNYKVPQQGFQQVYKIANEFDDVPQFGFFSTDQTKFIATSRKNVLFVDLNKDDSDKSKETDLDQQEGLSEIRALAVKDDNFYVLANKHKGKLGFYMIHFNLNNPKESHYYISWNNKLDIGDADMYPMSEGEGSNKKDFILVCYKMIGVNTYNVFVFDQVSHLIRYWFEGYQLWESRIKGFLLSSNDFLMLGKEGMQMLSIGTKASRTVRDKDKQKRMVHALGKTNYLKIEDSNHIFFSMQFYDDRQIRVQEQYNDQSGNTHFSDIFSIKIHEITLRELMLVQSVYACKVQSDIEHIVMKQPNPNIFFKVFLELGIKSMISYLAFDIKAIR